MTDYKTICSILGELWSDYRTDPEFKTFIEYNDLGLPLAYSLSEGLVEEITEVGQKYVLETFNLLVSALELDIENIKDGMSLVDLFELAKK